MSGKHTPGPWTIWTSNSYRRIVSDTTRREVLCGTVQRSDGCPDLHFPNGGHEGPDARLIAAAPELLAVAEMALSYIEAVCFNTPNEKKRRNYADAASQIRATLSKARGAA